MAVFPIVQSAQRAVLGVAITFAMLPLVALFLRLWAGRIVKRQLNLSDYFIVVAAIFAIAHESIIITGVVHAGMGYDHTATIVASYGPEPVKLLMQLFIPLQILWVFSLTFCKLSVLMFYINIFRVGSLIWMVRATAVIIILWAIATVLATFLMCQPLAKLWDQTLDGHCGDQKMSFTACGIVNLVTDAVVLVLPLPQLVKLQLATYKKVTLISVFGIGFMTCIISGFRIAALATLDFDDITFSIPSANIFSALEPSIAVTIACIPLLRPLVGSSKLTPSGNTYQLGSSGRRTKPDDGFQPLEDDSSQYRLRPIGTQHHAEVVSNDHTNISMPEIDDRSDKESAEISRAGMVTPSHAAVINIKKEWEVSEEAS